MMRRLLPIALLIAFLGMVWCGLILPSHACCRVDSERMGAMEAPEHSGLPVVAACCQTKALAFSGANGLDSPEKPPPISFAPPVLPVWTDLSGQPRHVAIQRQFIPDQSRRHLELSVLLN